MANAHHHGSERSDGLETARTEAPRLPARSAVAPEVGDLHEAHSVTAHGGHGHSAASPRGLHVPSTDTPTPHGGHGAEAHADHEAHDRHAGHDPEAFRRRFWLAFLLTVPTVLFSEMIQHWFGYSLAGVPGARWVPPILGSAVFLYGGPVFLRGGWQELRWRQPGMMLLISLAILVAFAASLATEIGLLHLDFWWELAALISVMLFGHWQEMRALGLSRGALAALAELLPDEADLIDGDLTRRVPLDELRAGDLVLVRPGARVPADGVVVEGRAEFDESMLTGESRPVVREVGARVAAGTVALASSVRVQVASVGEETALAGIRRMVAEAQASQSRAQAIADRAAAALFYIAIGAGLVTFIAWSAAGDLDAAVARTVTVLVIACPHALGLAIPLVIAISTELAARNGILVKDRLALERMRTVDVVLFDKTGTLTAGEPVVTGTWAADGDIDDMLRLASAAEADSEHPLARAIVRSAGGLAPQSVASGFATEAGRGVRAQVDGHLVEVGSPRLVAERGIDLSTIAPLATWIGRGATVLYVLRDGALVGALSLEDRVRHESHEAVHQLHAAGIEVAMITGDARNVAMAVALDLDIDEVFAEVLPGDKSAQVETLQRRGRRVAMVGDGVNDAPALARADVGIAIGAGTDVAIESAGVILASDDPRAVLGITRLSRASYRKMLQNLAWATGYNVVAIPLAAGALAFAGIALSPAVAALLMSASTVVVAINAELLRGLRLQPGIEDSP